MFYFEYDKEGNILFRHNEPFDSLTGLGLTREELEKRGILKESIPELKKIENKQAVLKVNIDNSELYYEYVDLITEEEKKLIEENENLKKENEKVKQNLLNSQSYIVDLEYKKVLENGVVK